MRSLWAGARFIVTVVFHKLLIVLLGLWMNWKLRSTKLRIGWLRLLRHDLSKFSRAEFWGYAEHYFGKIKGKEKDTKYEAAFYHHCHQNDHHHEHYFYYVPVEDSSLYINAEDEDSRRLVPNAIKRECREMPIDATLELFADWFAAALAYDFSIPQHGKWPFISRSLKRITDEMHECTKYQVVALLAIFGFENCALEALGRASAWTSPPVSSGEAIISNERVRLKFEWDEVIDRLRLKYPKSSTPKNLEALRNLYRHGLR